MSQDLLTANRPEPPAAGVSPAAAPPWIRTQLGNWLEQAGMLAILAVLVIVCSLTVNDFFTLRNLDSLLLAVSTVGIISCTMLFCLASGNFDLSVGTIVPCAQLTTPVWICIGCFLFFGFLLQRTTFGRNTLAIGGNEEAARLAGIPVARIKILIFVMQGIVAALAGMVLASRMTSGQPKSSDGLELQVISACVLGGVSLTGGIGRMSFVIAGVFIMGVVQNAMNLKNVDPFYQYVVSGTILLLAVLFDRVKQMRSGTAI